MNFIEQKNYDINSSDSRNFCIEETANEFLSKYYILINQYIGFYVENIYDNITINTDKRYRFYILSKGLEILSNIMNITIMYTNNIDFAFHYCNKAYYYYIEFISQLDTDNNHLELNIKDAIIFVYKKTIFEIKEPVSTINNCNINEDNVRKTETIKKMINIVNSYVKVFKFKDIINQNINNTDFIDAQIVFDKQFLKMINRIEKTYSNEKELSRSIGILDNIFNSIVKVFNKFNLVSSDDCKIEDSINFQQLILFIDKLLIRLCQQDEHSEENTPLDFDSLITRDVLKGLNNIKIRQMLSTID